MRYSAIVGLFFFLAAINAVPLRTRQTSIEPFSSNNILGTIYPPGLGPRECPYDSTANLWANPERCQDVRACTPRDYGDNYSTNGSSTENSRSNDSYVLQTEPEIFARQEGADAVCRQIGSIVLSKDRDFLLTASVIVKGGAQYWYTWFADGDVPTWMYYKPAGYQRKGFQRVEVAPSRQRSGFHAITFGVDTEIQFEASLQPTAEGLSGDLALFRTEGLQNIA